MPTLNLCDNCYSRGRLYRVKVEALPIDDLRVHEREVRNLCVDCKDALLKLDIEEYGHRREQRPRAWELP